MLSSDLNLQSNTEGLLKRETLGMTQFHFSMNWQIYSKSDKRSSFISSFVLEFLYLIKGPITT